MTRDDWVDVCGFPIFIIVFLVLDFAATFALYGISLLTGAWPWFIAPVILALAGTMIGLVAWAERHDLA